MPHEQEAPRAFDPAHVSPGGFPHRYIVGALEVTKLSVGRYDNNAYLVADRAAGEAVLVDAAAEPGRLLALLQGVRLLGVITTHRHADHWGALAEVLGSTGAWSAANEHDGGHLPVPPDRFLAHGDTVDVGGEALRVLFTPGHTEGSICVLVGSEHVLTGDTLFPGGVGKTGSPEAFTRALGSVERHLFTLPPETRVSPGHGDDTTIGREAPNLEQWRTRGW